MKKGYKNGIKTYQFQHLFKFTSSQKLDKIDWSHTKKINYHIS